MQTKKIALLLLLIVIVCTFSYYYVDRQLVWLLASHHNRDLLGLSILANHIPNIIGAFVFIFYIFFAIYIYNRPHRFHALSNKLLVVCNAIVIAVFLKDSLKLIFGRAWTSTFICNNPSLLENNVYGFNWFAHEPGFASFPSGHTTLTFAFSISMWFLFPKLRWMWMLLATMVTIGQIGMYYHFVSDVIAGAALGSVVAIYNYHYWVRSNHAKIVL